MGDHYDTHPVISTLWPLTHWPLWPIFLRLTHWILRHMAVCVHVCEFVCLPLIFKYDTIFNDTLMASAIQLTVKQPIPPRMDDQRCHEMSWWKLCAIELYFDEMISVCGRLMKLWFQSWYLQVHIFVTISREFAVDSATNFRPCARPCCCEWISNSIPHLRCAYGILYSILYSVINHPCWD